MKAIVFGSSGFIGGHVAEQLHKAGHEVSAAVRKGSSNDFLKSLGVTLTEVDFTNDNSIGTAIRGHDVVYNCAADSSIDQDKELHEQRDILLAKKLVELASLSGASRFIQLSSIIIYDFLSNDQIDENYIPQPEFVQQKIMLEKEKAVIEAGQRAGLETIILRPASTIGARDQKSFFARLFNAHSMDQFPMVNEGAAHVSLIDARDIGRAMSLLGTFEKSTEDKGVYLLKGFDTSWLGLKEEIDRAVGRNAGVVALPADEASFMVKNLSVNRLWDDGKIRGYGFNPIFTLREAVETEVNDLLKQAR